MRLSTLSASALPALRAAATVAFAAGAAAAGTDEALAAPAVTAAASAPAAPASAAAGGQLTVIEDKNVRIEETRIRGQLTHVTVQSKLRGAKPYEIIVGPGGRDPSQEPGAQGQRAWSVFDF